MLWLVSLKPRPRYLVSGLFALMYGCFRFAVEFVRVPDAAAGLSGLGLGDDGAAAVAAADRGGSGADAMSRRAPVLPLAEWPAA